MTHPGACPDCLRRSWLLGLAAPYIERAIGAARSAPALELFCLSNEALAEAVAPKVATMLVARVDALPESHFTDELRAADCWAICRHDSHYPQPLREAPGAPGALIARGDPALMAAFEPSESVALVGARRATSYGRETARALGSDLAAVGLTVVSDLAFGIDACAIRGALDTGSTVAVLGSGPDVAYPAAHRSLWRRVTEGGLIVSELPPGAAPWRWTFPASSRIMAALAGITVVVEAGLDSRSLLAAELARSLDHEVGAVPGPVSARLSAGTNALLADHRAHLIRDADDVLDVLVGDSPETEAPAADLSAEPS